MNRSRRTQGSRGSVSSAAAETLLGLAAFRLAAHAYDSLETIPDVIRASQFVVEAIAALLPVRSVNLELAKQVSSGVIRFPAGAAARETPKPGGEEIVFQGDDRSILRCWVEWEGRPPGGLDGVYDRAFAGFMLHALCRRVAGEVERGRLLKRLSGAERAVAELLDLKAVDIAERLGVAKATVDSHLKQIYRKLDVHSRAEAAAALGISAGGLGRGAGSPGEGSASGAPGGKEA